MKRAALLSVTDKTGLKEFAITLQKAGLDLLATSGTKSYLEGEGIKTVSIEEYTAQKEILDGRVKTLHPRIHAGLLAKRDKQEHINELIDNDIYSIEVAVINLYPFVKTLEANKDAPLEKMVEYVDIGGPTMIRAAAKNCKYVVPVIDPTDYPRLATYFEKGENIPLEVRIDLARKVFTFIANYDLEIARYLSRQTDTQEDGFAPVEGLVLQKQQSLRYGENPHQKGAFYRAAAKGAPSWKQLNGKELSYNNLLDFDAALKLMRSFPHSSKTAVIIKHLNPCGAASANTLIEALKKAKQGDPRSHFGGVLAFNSEVTAEVAEEVRGDFAEIVLAPSFASDALELLRKNKNLRVIEVPLTGTPTLEIRAVEGGYLLQESDSGATLTEESSSATSRALNEQERKDLAFAWTVCAHVKSNAIVLVKDEMILATGAGQMSRIDSVELALSKAARHGHDTKGAVCASDAFFPFSDSVETLAAHGISCVISPSGAKRDEEVLQVAEKAGLSFVFADKRHFRH